jgi:hypothetical protein
MTYFRTIVERVSQLRPGESVTFDQYMLGQGWGGTLGALLSDGFTPMDRVLENVIGSSVTHRYSRDRDGNVIFLRLHTALPDGVRSYVSPDRLGYFDQRADGLYQHCEVRPSPEDELLIRCALEGHELEPAWVMPPLEPIGSVTDIAPDATVQFVEGKRCRNCRCFPDQPTGDERPSAMR